jgi:hypothetical protein
VRRLALLVTALLLVACSDSNSSSTASAPPTTSADGQTTIVIGPDGSSTVVDVPPDTSAPQSSSSADNGTSDPSGADPNGPVGSYGATILGHDVRIEIRTQTDANPDQHAVDHLAGVLRSVSGHAVSVTSGGAIAGGAKDWSADELRALAGPPTTAASTTVAIHLLYVHGTFEGNDGVLGAAVQGDTAAIFIDRIHESATPLIGSAGIETAVTTHEVGHLLGLVDLVLHTGRQDAEHPGHSTNRQSVMYWAVESSLIADVLTGGPPTEFDSADLADLAVIRGNG